MLMVKGGGGKPLPLSGRYVLFSCPSCSRKKVFEPNMFVFQVQFSGADAGCAGDVEDDGGGSSRGNERRVKSLSPGQEVSPPPRQPWGGGASWGVGSGQHGAPPRS